MKSAKCICTGHASRVLASLFFIPSFQPPFLFWRTRDTCVCLPPYAYSGAPLHSSRGSPTRRKSKRRVGRRLPCAFPTAQFSSLGRPDNVEVYRLWHNEKSSRRARRCRESETGERTARQGRAEETSKGEEAKLMAAAAGSEGTRRRRARSTVPREVSVQRLNQASHQAAGRKLLAITPQRFGRNGAAHSSPRRPRSDNARADNERPAAHARTRAYARR